MMITKCLHIFTREMLYSQYFHNKSYSSRLLQIVVGRQKSIFIGKFKLELITIYYLWFIMKVLWKMLWMSHLFFTIPLFLTMVGYNIIYIYIYIINTSTVVKILWQFAMVIFYSFRVTTHKQIKKIIIIKITSKFNRRCFPKKKEKKKS